MEKETFDLILYIVGLMALIGLFIGLVEIEKKKDIDDTDKTAGGFM